MLSETEPIIIKFFGSFSIRQGENVICETDNRSKKLWKLLEYIVQNRDRQIPQEELVSLLWPERGEEENPMSSLKTLLHRVRNTLDQLDFDESRHLILQHNGCYFWNPRLPVRIDTEDFEVAAERTKIIDQPEEKLNSALRAMAQYKGHYLGGKYKNEAWAAEPGKRYGEQYLYCYNTAVQIFAGEERYDEIVFLSRHAIEIEPSEEIYYYNLISALIAKGAGEEALAAYEEVLDLFYHTYRKTPSDSLRSLYRSIVRSGNSVEMDIAIVREKLDEDRVKGVIRCEYDTFKLLYEQKCLAAAGRGSDYLILLTVTPADRSVSVPEKKHLDRALSQLESQLSNTLSEGDVYTRYSLTQLLVIASLPDEDALFAFLKKTRRCFHAENPSCPVEISFKADKI